MQPLDPAIEVLSGTDVADVWDRFEVFEALHHSMRICNPMTSAQLDELVGALDLQGGQQIVDFGCGYGEMLIRAAAVAPIIGAGIDLSPWMVATALAESNRRCPGANLRWVLGEARDYLPEPASNVALCIGAEWLWHDFGGTARALSKRLVPGGVAAIGAGRLHHDADPETVAAERGRIETVDDQAALLRSNGLEPLHRIDPDDAGWDAYLGRTADAAAAWAARFPSGRSRMWQAEQVDWQTARDRDRSVVGWSVWVARKHGPRA